MASGKKKISLILVGAGGMGARWADAAAAHPEARLGAIVDTDVKKAEAIAKQYGVPAFSSLKNIPGSLPADAAVIAVPPAPAARAIQTALNARLHVLAEKPCAANSRELKKLAALAHRKKLRFMAGYNYRHFPHIRAAHELVKNGSVGDIMFIRSRHGASGRPGYEKDWRHNKRLSGGGVLIDQAVHTIDLARWFLGDFKKISGRLANTFWKSEVEDNAFLHLETAGGKIASLHASWTEWKPKFCFEIFGADGYIIAEGLRQYRQEERLIIAKRPRDFLGSHVKEKIITFPDSQPQESLAGELTEFISAIRRGHAPKPDAADALAVLKIAEAIYREC